MKIKTIYKGLVKNVVMISYDKKPKGMKVEQQLTRLYADEGKKLKHKETGELFDNITLGDVTEDMFYEVDAPKESETN